MPAAFHQVPTMKVAVIGSGISGLSAAHRLAPHAAVTLFEADDYFGGHTHTVDVCLPTAQGPVTHGVDTGFLVYNERTYPTLIALFQELGVETAHSDMSFSVQVGGTPQRGAIEWSGSSLNTVFAQRSNLLRPEFLGMLRDLLRFNRLTTEIAMAQSEAAMQQPLGDFLRTHRFGDAFCNWYFLPMMGCIWSCPTSQMLQFPVATMIRFCHNHGLLQVTNRPQWWTVRGGARQYVHKILAHIDDKRLRTPVRAVRRLAQADGGGVEVSTDHGTTRFDKLVIATHSDQALALLSDPTPAEQATLGAIRYHRNRAVLHTDSTMLPTRRAAWAAWNYESTPVAGASGSSGQDNQVCLHYLINMLQPVPWAQPVVVSLNPLRAIRSDSILGEYDYAHPVFDAAAIRAQHTIAGLQGQRDTYYSGAWLGYGFHEDGIKSGQAAARMVLESRQAAPVAEVLA
jgi:predicted NAD/FAD-binding protein